MPIDKCPTQHVCNKFSDGTNRPSNHDVRTHYPCSKMEHCEAYNWNKKWLATGPSCNLRKMRRLKCK